MAVDGDAQELAEAATRLLQIPDLVDVSCMPPVNRSGMQLAHDDDQLVVLEQVLVRVDQRLVGARLDHADLSSSLNRPACRAGR
jgi:hypothetical protein